jgi:hypothetical protein
VLGAMGAAQGWVWIGVTAGAPSGACEGLVQGGCEARRTCLQ